MKQVEKKTWNKSVFFTYFAPKARLEELLVLEEGGEDRSEKSIEDSMPDGVVKAAHFSYNDSEKERLQTEAWETVSYTHLDVYKRQDHSSVCTWMYFGKIIGNL